ncbi:MAG: carboxypeptidase regulatory-like domain-containing protein [Desulfopila sp.]
MRRQYLAKVSCLAMVLGMFFVLAAPAMAHKVNIFAYVEGDVVYTESYFPDGRMVENGTIEVLDASGNKLLEGTTDQEGHFFFPLPEKKEDLTIVINASMGHKNSYLLQKSEM